MPLNKSLSPSMKPAALSLIDLVRRRICEEMIAPSRASADLESGATSAGLVLVVDSHTLKIVSSVCKRSELSEKGALFIEQIERPRQPFPDLDVIYFLAPSSAPLLLQDHTRDLYRYSNVFFTSKVDPDLFGPLTASSQFVSRCKNFVELNLDFVCFEPTIFHCDAPMTLSQLSDERRWESLIQVHVDCLSSLCASLGERPVIRFHEKSVSNLAQRVALGLRRETDSLAKSANADLLKSSGTTVLILDRSIDSGVLLVHDFFYQALALDILDGVEPTGVQWALGHQPERTSEEQATSVVPSFSYTAVTGKGTEEKRKMLLSDSDFLWAKFRHEHFRVVSESISKEITALVRSNEIARRAISGGSPPAADPLELLRGIPEFQDQISKLSVHLELSKKLLEVFESLRLMSVAALEQQLLTGLDDDGKEVGCTKIYNAMLALLGDHKTIAPEERLRLVMLYLSQVNDVSETTARELVKSVAGLDGDFERAVTNFLSLGIHGTKIAAPEGVVAGATGARGSLITIPSTRHTLKFASNKARMKRHRAVARTSKFVNCRYQSELREIVETVLNNGLDSTAFPHVGGTGTSTYVAGGISADGVMGIQKSAAAMWGQVMAQDAGGRRQKLVVFVIGGVTLAETREVSELAQQFGIDVLLGGSSILTPKRVVEILLTK